VKVVTKPEFTIFEASVRCFLRSTVEIAHDSCSVRSHCALSTTFGGCSVC